MGFRYIFQNPLMQKFLHILAILVTTVVLAACGGGSSSTSPSAPTAAASTTGWTWVSGSNEPGATSVYGSLGVFASSNQPGSRKDVIGWSDATGNLWMFGGYGPDVSGNSGYLNDLWKFTQ